MTLEKLKTAAEVVKLAVDIVGAIADRIEKRRRRDKRIADSRPRSRS